jgi:hypothetical protein
MPVTTLRPNTAKCTLRAAFACALGCAVVLACAPARAADDDEAFDTKILRGLLEGLGLRNSSTRDIDYRERSPLVIPPSRALPSPEKDAASGNPNWPVDPEVKRDKELKAAERARRNSGDWWTEEARPLRPDELNKGTTRQASAREAGAPSDVASASRMTPSQLGYKGGLFENMFGKGNEENARFTAEPPRVSLTEPPPGYQTPSPDQPYGVGKDRSKPKATDYLTEHSEYGH